MQEYLDDPVILILLGACLILIVAVIIGIVTTIKKNKNRVPMYKTKIVYNKVLEQYLITTDTFNFGASPKENVQSELLKEEYPIGRRISFDSDEKESLELTVSCYRKVSVPSLSVEIPYKIYFKKYENIEFPREFTIQKNKKYSSILLTSNGFELQAQENTVEKYTWESIKIDHLNEFVSVYWKDKPQLSKEILRFVQVEDNMYKSDIRLKQEDYMFICEILQKYAEWAWV